MSKQELKVAIDFTRHDLITEAHAKSFYPKDGTKYGHDQGHDCEIHADLITSVIEQINTAHVQSGIGPVEDILDYGCGPHAALAHAIKTSFALKIEQYDPCLNNLATLPSPRDIVVCYNVLEYVESLKISNVIAHIASCTKRAAFFHVHVKTRGTKDYNYWLPRLWEQFYIQSFAQSHTGFYLVALPKQN